MKTDTNLHQQLQGLIAALIPPTAFPARKPRILDLGCGEGALAQRCFDQGYDVVAVDCDALQFKAQGPAFIPIDLNDAHAVDQLVANHQGAFDLILAVEVIEHLRCPCAFRLSPPLQPETHLIVTTPNVSSWWSRLWFFLTGDLWGFSPKAAAIRAISARCPLQR